MVSQPVLHQWRPLPRGRRPTRRPRPVHLRPAVLVRPHPFPLHFPLIFFQFCNLGETRRIRFGTNQLCVRNGESQSGDMRSAVEVAAAQQRRSGEHPSGDGDVKALLPLRHPHHAHRRMQPHELPQGKGRLRRRMVADPIHRGFSVSFSFKLID